MLCDDRRCFCHPPREKPFQKLELVLTGTKSEGSCRLDQPGAQLDVVFNLIENSMTLREKVDDTGTPKAAYTIYLTLDSKMWHFENLKGLPNMSLLLSLRMRSSFCIASGRNKLQYREKFQGFSPNRVDSKLYNNFYNCTWTEQHLQLLLPRERIKGWRTAALILKTFKRISPENYCHMLRLGMKQTVQGLNWSAIESEIMPKEDAPPSPVTSAEEEDKLYLMEKKKIARKEFQKHAHLFEHRPVV
ncbi:hypothetical protein BJY04DRAFT_223554 [Aspergillus karnatakaensis]|uniref:uncharacterized protein n=1 Tax=Aspergillus karnatakaensis TaxID=1810916 RepID=UPI003CCCE1D8